MIFNWVVLEPTLFHLCHISSFSYRCKNDETYENHDFPLTTGQMSNSEVGAKVYSDHLNQ